MNYKESDATTPAKQEKSTSSMCYIYVCVYLFTNINHGTGANLELRWDEYGNISNYSKSTKQSKEKGHLRFYGKYCVEQQKTKEFVRFSKLLKSREKNHVKTNKSNLKRY